MPLGIAHSTDPDEILPILSVLRDRVPQELAHARLTAALAQGYRTLLAREGALTVGCLGFRFVADVFWGKTLFIDDLVVRSEWRGKGIGQALLTSAKGEASTQSCDKIRLCSGLARHDTHRFYERNGFEKVSYQFACPIE